MIAAVLLAAGESSRFGRPKLLERWKGDSLVARVARVLLGAGLRPVVVVVPPLPAFRAALRGLEVDIVENPEPARGIGRSVALGIAALPKAARAALVAVADQPLIDEAAIRRLCEAFGADRIVVPRYGSHPGNPRIFDRQFFPELAALRGDVGGQVVAAAHPDAVVECRFDERIGWDVDVPADWARLLTPPPSGRT